MFGLYPLKKKVYISLVSNYKPFFAKKKNYKSFWSFRTN